MKEHWREYLIEAWGLGTFMISAGIFATTLYSPGSPFSMIISNDFIKGLAISN